MKWFELSRGVNRSGVALRQCADWRTGSVWQLRALSIFQNAFQVSPRDVFGSPLRIDIKQARARSVCARLMTGSDCRLRLRLPLAEHIRKLEQLDDSVFTVHSLGRPYGAPQRK